MNGVRAAEEIFHLGNASLMGALVGAQNVASVAKQDGEVTVEEGGIADQAHLTGDPEWDAIEMEETDPTKPPLQVVR